MRQVLSAVVVLSWCVGCAGWNVPRKDDPEGQEVAETEVAGAPSAKGKMVCHDEYPTGSHVPERVCRYQDDSNDEANQTQIMLDSMRNNQMQPGH
jgi:hypothetical protein